MKGYVSSSSRRHAVLFRKRHESVSNLQANEWRRTHVWEIFTSMGTTRLFTGSSRGDCLDGALEDIAQFKRLHEIPTSYPAQSELGTNGSRGRSSRVPNHAPVLDADIIKVFIDGANLLDTFIESILGPEHSSVSLHGLLHVKTDLGSWLGTIRAPK